MPKFVQTLETEVFKTLTNLARERGISVQELIRAIIVPEWLKNRRNHYPPERKIQLLKDGKD